jgi:putative ABC transport system permease protein
MKLFIYIINIIFSIFKSSFILIRLGFEEIAFNPIKNSLTSATLMLSVSLVITLSCLTESYEASLLDWVDREFPFEYSIVHIRDIEDGTDFGIPVEIREKVKEVTGIKEVGFMVVKTGVESGNKLYTIHGSDIALARKIEIEKNIKSGYPDNYKGNIIISSNMAYLEKLNPGESLELPTKKGNIKFKIVGIREHFFSENGTIMMDERDFREYFGLNRFGSIKFNLLDSANKIESLKSVENIIKNYPDLKIINQDNLKSIYLGGVRKIFKVLDSLKFTASLISLFSLFSSILYSLSEKLKKYAVLYANGASWTQLHVIALSENFFIIFFGSIMGFLSFGLLSPIVIGVINKNAFGWTIPILIPWKIAFLFIFSTPILGVFTLFLPYLVFKNLSLRKVLSYE